MDSECQLVEFLVCMHDRGDSLADIPNLEFFLVSLPFGGPWFADYYKYWARLCDFEVRISMNGQLTKMFVGFHNVEVFALLPLDRPVFYEPLPNWRVS